MPRKKKPQPPVGPIQPDEIEQMREEVAYESKIKGKPKYLRKWHKRRVIDLPCPTCGAVFGACRVLPKRKSR